jgi:WD40 repeat protein
MVAAEFRASAFLANGTAFVGISLDGKLQVWETLSGKLRKVSDEVNKFSVSVIDGGLNLHKVICGTDAGSVFCVDLQTGDVVQMKEKHTGKVTAVKIHPNGEKAYSVGLDKGVIEWDLNTGRVTKKFKGGKSGVGAIAVSKDGRFLVCASATMRVFDLSSGEKWLV